MVDVTDEFDRDWLIRKMANRIDELEREVADLCAENGALERHNIELRGAVAALLAPPVSENFTHPASFR